MLEPKIWNICGQYGESLKNLISLRRCFDESQLHCTSKRSEKFSLEIKSRSMLILREDPKMKGSNKRTSSQAFPLRKMVSEAKYFST